MTDPNVEVVDRSPPPPPVFVVFVVVVVPVPPPVQRSELRLGFEQEPPPLVATAPTDELPSGKEGERYDRCRTPPLPPAAAAGGGGGDRGGGGAAIVVRRRRHVDRPGRRMRRCQEEEGTGRQQGGGGDGERRATVRDDGRMSHDLVPFCNVILLRRVYKQNLWILCNESDEWILLLGEV